MTKSAVFTVELDAELRDDFMSEVGAANRPLSEVMRELMREFVDRQRDQREYDAFLQRKVAKARRSIAAGKGRSNDEVEAAFAARRESITAGG